MSKDETNVLDFNTRKPMLPFQVRAILMAQYAASKENDHSAELFIKQLEDRLLTAGAACVVEMTRGFITDLLEGTDERKDSQERAQS